MKKILIVQDNLRMGGIQKSLVNFLNALSSEYDLTVLLFERGGALSAQIPKQVRVRYAHPAYSLLNVTKKQTRRRPALFLAKTFFYLWSRFFGRKSAMRLLGVFQKKLRGYDIAISYAHPMVKSAFSGGAAEFVLQKVQAERKFCFVHCDYQHSGNAEPYTNELYGKFNKIVCVSESVKERFLFVLPALADRTQVLYNFYDLNVVGLAEKGDVLFDPSALNLVTVARLSPEKGIDRMIEAIHLSSRRDLCYYVVGSGPAEVSLCALVERYGLGKQVFFVGETMNPYVYMKQADYVVVSSYHEAAPMVFDEAKTLGVPVIATETTSAREMLGEQYGIVCDNSTEGLLAVLRRIKKHGQFETITVDNNMQKAQFEKLCFSGEI